MAAAGAAPEVEAWCRGAGRHEAACRAAWVAPRLRPDGPPTAALLAACAEAPACALDVLDHRATGTVDAQLAACAAHTGPLVGHCVHHALQRWSRDRPASPEVLALLATARGLPAPTARWTAFHLGELAWCGRRFSCDDLEGPESALCTEGQGPFRTGRQRCDQAPSGRPPPPPARGGPHPRSPG